MRPDRDVRAYRTWAFPFVTAAFSKNSCCTLFANLQSINSNHIIHVIPIPKNKRNDPNKRRTNSKDNISTTICRKRVYRRHKEQVLIILANMHRYTSNTVLLAAVISSASAFARSGVTSRVATKLHLENHIAEM